MLFWRPSGLSAHAGLLPVILGGALGLWCATRAAISWRRLLTVLVFYFGWFVLFSPFGLFSATGTPIVAKEPSSAAGLAGAVSWTLCFWLAATFWYSTRSLLAAAVARVGRADRWEMSLDRHDPYHPKPEEKWEAPRFDDVREELAILASAESQTSHMLLTVRSREIERGAMAEMRGDKRNAVRHFLAAAHLELVLAGEYEDNAQFELALRSRERAASCFWRAGHVVEARSLFEELKQENRFLAQVIDGVVMELEKSHKLEKTPTLT